MGAWTALWLRRAGHEVTLVDRYGPGNRIGSSGDETRITRSSHGTDRHYPVWQRRALAHWRDLERGSGLTLFVPAGVVWLASNGGTFETDSLESLTALGIPAERWSSDDLAARVPVMNAASVPWALFEPEGGVLMARAGVGAAIASFESAGGEIVVGRAVPPGEAGPGGLDHLKLDGGRTLEADAYVFACGPWLPDLFPSALGELIVAHRQDVMHFAVPPGDSRYGPEVMPAWIDFDGSFYGLPSVDGVGLKACPDWLGPVERPEGSPREIAASTIEASRAVLRNRLPGVADQEVVRTWACFYEVTPDAHFVIDRHPQLGNAWIAGGGTGHAFKHGPVIGEYLAALVTGDSGAAAALAPPDDRFAIGARDTKQSFRTSGRNPLEAAPA
jgi:glycine/D-amino acid oxidase-like deaminating enzyme